jgi:hypothetical protein
MIRSKSWNFTVERYRIDRITRWILRVPGVTVRHTVKVHPNKQTNINDITMYTNPILCNKSNPYSYIYRKKKKIHGSWGRCLRAGSRTPVEGKRGRWADQPPDWVQ